MVDLFCVFNLQRVCGLAFFLIISAATSTAQGIYNPYSGYQPPTDMFFMPSAPSFPQSMEECRATQSNFDVQASKLETEHQACLDALKSQTRPVDPNQIAVCSVAACQMIHDAWQNADHARKAVASMVSDCEDQVNAMLARKANPPTTPPANVKTNQSTPSQKSAQPPKATEKPRLDPDALRTKLAYDQRERQLKELADRTAKRQQEYDVLDKELEKADSLASSESKDAGEQLAQLDDKVLQSSGNSTGTNNAPPLPSGDDFADIPPASGGANTLSTNKATTIRTANQADSSGASVQPIPPSAFLNPNPDVQHDVAELQRLDNLLAQQKSFENDLLTYKKQDQTNANNAALLAGVVGVLKFPADAGAAGIGLLPGPGPKAFAAGYSLATAAATSISAAVTSDTPSDPSSLSDVKGALAGGTSTAGEFLAKDGSTATTQVLGTVAQSGGAAVGAVVDARGLLEAYKSGDGVGVATSTVSGLGNATTVIGAVLKNETATGYGGALTTSATIVKSAADSTRALVDSVNDMSQSAIGIPQSYAALAAQSQALDQKITARRQALYQHLMQLLQSQGMSTH